VLVVVLLVLTVAGAWALASIAVALLAGGVIRARDEHETGARGFRSPFATSVRH